MGCGAAGKDCPRLCARRSALSFPARRHHSVLRQAEGWPLDPMATYSDVATAQKRRPVHRMTASRDAVAVVVMCTCGWSDKILRCEDIRAHTVKVRSAWVEHERQIAAERTNEA